MKATPENLRRMAAKAAKLGRKHTAVAFFRAADRLEFLEQHVADLQRKLAAEKLRRD